MSVRGLWNSAIRFGKSAWELVAPLVRRVRQWITAKRLQVIMWGKLHPLLATLAVYAGLMLLLTVASISYVSPITPEERNNVIQTIAQIGGGTALVIGLYFTWRTVSASDRNHQLLVKGQLFERYTKLVEQLGSEDQSMRIGAVYALEELSRDSENDYDTIIEVLAAFVRTRGKWHGRSLGPLPPRDDVQAALTVLGRRRLHAGNSNKGGLLLGGTDIRSLDLSGGHFEKTRFEYAHLGGAMLVGTHLERAIFYAADLTGTYFVVAPAQYSSFTLATLDYAVFIYPSDQMLSETGTGDYDQAFINYWMKFSEEPPEHRRLPTSQNLGRLLHGADFSAAHLGATDFRSADLSKVVGMTEAQFYIANTGEHTVKPEHFADPPASTEGDES